jgi:Ricin-type beta-trefoil lectin domain
MAGTCTVKSAGGLYLTWDSTRPGPSPVHLAPKPSLPGAFWNLGYGGFEIKVGTVGRTLCLGAVARRGRHRQYRIDLSPCAGRRWQEWTLVGTRTFGSHIQFRSIARYSMCLTAKRSGSSKRIEVVLENCAGWPDQTWST